MHHEIHLYFFSYKFKIVIMIHKPKYNIKFINYKIKYLQMNQISRFKRESKSSK